MYIHPVSFIAYTAHNTNLYVKLWQVEWLCEGVAEVSNAWHFPPTTDICTKKRQHVPAEQTNESYYKD